MRASGQSEIGAVVLFDGVCNLCNSTVNFIIDRDPGAYFRFAPLQSEAAEPYLKRCHLPQDFLLGVVLVEGDRCYTRSAATLRILRRLSAPWPLAYACIGVPRPLRDALYAWIIGNRYRWFGRRVACRMPTPDVASRFLPGATRVSGDQTPSGR